MLCGSVLLPISVAGFMQQNKRKFGCLSTILESLHGGQSLCEFMILNKYVACRSISGTDKWLKSSLQLNVRSETYNVVLSRNDNSANTRFSSIKLKIHSYLNMSKECHRLTPSLLKGRNHRVLLKDCSNTEEFLQRRGWFHLAESTIPDVQPPLKLPK